MNGKLIVRLVEAALTGRSEQVRILANIISNELRSYDPEASKELAKMSPNSLRETRERINPHLIQNSTIENSYILSATHPPKVVESPVLSEENKNKLSQLVKEHANIRKLLDNNLEPTKTLLFTGPPGVGKTITATWLANKMSLPLKVLDLATVMSSLLGKTGNNLKKVIDDASMSPCVLLLDEFDAIAKKRDDERDIGELKRLVTVLLQALDNWPSSSILIAATNHSELLDPAIWRRFELKLEFKNPTDEQIKEYLINLTGSKEIIGLHKFFSGMSFSEIKNEILKNKKKSIIENQDFISQIAFSFLNSGKIDELSIDDKKALAVNLVTAKFSQRKVADLLKISRPTVKKALAE